MAADGGFEVNQAGGEALLGAIRHMKDWLNSQENKLFALRQELPLGSSHAAQVMKPYVQNVAVDEQGFLTQLAKFRESLSQAEQGIQTAMANYHATEEANRQALRKAETA
jgi:Pyruvate/2-oxoacid:ferredoxin oxidoreductase gamma subunit